jgi:hypothetical protein
MQPPAVKTAWPRRQWKAASQQTTRRKPRPIRKRKKKSGEGEGLPWLLPKALSADEEIWLDYRIFKAAGLLKEWVALYRHALNLEL